MNQIGVNFSLFPFFLIIEIVLILKIQKSRYFGEKTIKNVRTILSGNNKLFPEDAI